MVRISYRPSAGVSSCVAVGGTQRINCNWACVFVALTHNMTRKYTKRIGDQPWRRAILKKAIVVVLCWGGAEWEVRRKTDEITRLAVFFFQIAV